MARRVEALLAPLGVRAPLVATFHSACVRILRQHIQHLGYKPHFTIYDEDDRLALVKECVRERGARRRASLTATAIVHRISAAKNQMISVDEMAKAVRGPREMEVAAIYKRYQERLAATGAVDFDDLLLLVVRLFQEAPEVLAWYRGPLAARAGRRVPGHQPRAVPDDPPAHVGASQRVRRRATATSRCTDGAAPTSATSWTSRATIPARAWSSSSRTIARRSGSSRSPPASSRTTPSARRRRSGRRTPRVSRRASIARGTSTRSPGGWRSRSSARAARARPTATSRSSIAPTRSRACWRMRSAAPASRTSSSAASGSTSARRSRTSSRTCD